MHKISNTIGHARSNWTDRVNPSGFGLSRPHQDIRRPQGPPTATPTVSGDLTANLSFNVPFSSSLSGPEVGDILHNSPGAFQRWLMPTGSPEGTPINKLPVHQQNVEGLRRLCRTISDQSGGSIEALVTSSEPKATQALQRRPQGLVTNVCISGASDLVHKIRQKVLNETPILLVSKTQHTVRHTRLTTDCCSVLPLLTLTRTSSLMQPATASGQAS